MGQGIASCGVKAHSQTSPVPARTIPSRASATRRQTKFLILQANLSYSFLRLGPVELIGRSMPTALQQRCGRESRCSIGLRAEISRATTVRFSNWVTKVSFGTQHAPPFLDRLR